MKHNQKIFVFILIIAICSICFFSSCKSSEELKNSNVQMSIIEKIFASSKCSDNITSALSIQLKIILQNTSAISSSIENWKIDFYSDNVLLLAINKTNYESYGCADQAIDTSNEIVLDGYFHYYGFIEKTYFNQVVPNKVTITLTIKDSSGYTYDITDTY